MKGLKSALQFLTIIPVGKSEGFDSKSTAAFFPVAGLVIGILLVIVDRMAVHYWPMYVAALIDVVFLVVITGALHLDGLGDTADGLYGNRPKEKALSIMKDSRVGVMGLVAIVCCMFLKWGGISCLTENRSLLLLIIPAYSRGAMLFGFRYLDYGRPGGGTGSEFFKERLGISAFMWLIVPVFFSLALGFKFFWLNLCFAGITAGMLLYYKKKINCITGDMLGAMVEVNEALLFLLIAM